MLEILYKITSIFKIQKHVYFFAYMCSNIVANILYVNYYKIFYRYLKKSGVKISNLEPEYVVSLTSFPGRINAVAVCIETIMRQTMLPDRIILWLSRDQFSNSNLLPKELIHLKSRGLEIRFCEDLRSHKKYFFAMQEFPNSVVITMDDDVLYPRKTLERLIEQHKSTPDNICCNIASFYDRNSPYVDWLRVESKFVLRSEELVPIGVGGVLYPAGSLSKMVFNEEDVRLLCPHTDDLWLKVMSMINKTKITYCGEFPTLFTIFKTQSENLGDENTLRNDLELANILKKYEKFI